MEKLLSIKVDARAVLTKRINKYLAEVDIFYPFEKRGELVHIHDSGRLTDLVYPSREVSLAYSPKDTRKTRWDVIFSHGANGEDVLINTAYHNEIAKKILMRFWEHIIGEPILHIESEKRYLNKRFDFFIKTGDKSYQCEVKGVTKVIGDTAVFPDAPTKRGKEHLECLSQIVNTREHGGIVIFLVFMEKATFLSANSELDPLFAKAFNKALGSGVKCFAPVVISKKEELFFKRFIPVK